MVAFHYPPYEGGSGVHRTLKFSKYLPDSGWQPVVVSAHPRAYSSIGTEQLVEIPNQAVVERAFALDTGRHLSLRGRYLGITGIARPMGKLVVGWGVHGFEVGSEAPTQYHLVYLSHRYRPFDRSDAASSDRHSVGR